MRTAVRSLGWITAAFLLACSKPTSPPPAGSEPCQPGALRTCTCPKAPSNGKRRCAADGTHFLECQCPLPAAASTSTGRGVRPPGSATAADGGTTPDDASVAQAPSAAPKGTLAPGGELVAEPTDDASYVFDQNVVRTYNILIAPADQALLGAKPSAELTVPAMLEFEGQTYGPLGVRYKGNSFGEPCTSGGPDGPKAGKCSTKLVFDYSDPAARFYGLKKLNLHSMDNDPSELRDRLGYTLFREMGVAAPRSMHARVLINGKFEGLFIAVEQVDGRFTRARFTDGGKGNLYKEVWPVYDDAAAYMEKLESNKTESPSVQAMLSFKAAVDKGPAATSLWLDHDYTMRYLAVDRVIINDDGALHFWCPTATSRPGNGNYYWYEASSHDRLWLIAWDLDEAFDGSVHTHIAPEWTQPAPCGCKRGVYAYSQAASCDKLTKVFISWLDEYKAQVEAFVSGPFAAERVDVKLTAWTAQIEPFVTEAGGSGGAPTLAEWHAAVDELKAKIASAREHRGYAY